MKTFGGLPFASMINTLQSSELEKHSPVRLNDLLTTSRSEPLCLVSLVLQFPFKLHPSGPLQGGVVDRGLSEGAHDAAVAACAPSRGSPAQNLAGTGRPANRCPSIRPGRSSIRRPSDSSRRQRAAANRAGAQTGERRDAGAFHTALTSSPGSVRRTRSSPP